MGLRVLERVGRLPGASNAWLLVEEGSVHGSTETSWWGSGSALRRQT